MRSIEVKAVRDAIHVPAPDRARLRSAMSKPFENNCPRLTKLKRKRPRLQPADFAPMEVHSPVGGNVAGMLIRDHDATRALVEGEVSCAAHGLAERVQRRQRQNRDMSPSLTFHDVHPSDAIQGLAATVRDGVFTYRLFVAAEALRELGATGDSDTWLAVFERNESRIAERTARLRRALPNEAAFIGTFQD